MFNMENMKKAENEHEARRAVSNALLEMMLESAMPEEEKGDLRCIKAAREAHDAIGKVMERYADPRKRVPYEIAMQAAEYLGLVRVGIEQFLQTMREPDKSENAQKEDS